MGSNAPKSTSAYSVRNYSTILRNGNAFKLGDLDVSERHLLLELRRIIPMDEILDVKVERSLPKPGKISRASHERMSSEDLWSTIWGKVITNIRDEILCKSLEMVCRILKFFLTSQNHIIYVRDIYSMHQHFQ